MTAFNNIKVNNWPATSNDLEDFLVLKLPLNDTAALTESLPVVVGSNTVLHQKAALTNSSTVSTAAGISHALVFRGAGAPDKHLEDNTQTNGSFFSNSNHYDANDASTQFWDWTFDPPIPNVTQVGVNSRHINQYYNPYYYQCYDENDNALVASPADKTSVSTDTDIYSGSAINLKRIKMYGGAGGDDFYKIIVNNVALNQTNGIGTVTNTASHTATTTYLTGVPKNHYDNNADFGPITSNKFLRLEPSQDFSFGLNPFCIECWALIKETSISALWDLNTGSGFQSEDWMSGYYDASGMHFYWGIGSSYAAVNTSIPLNVWTHWAWTWDGTTARLFKNGSLANSATPTKTHWGASNRYFFIGKQNYDNPNRLGSAKIQDFRIYKGAAKYTANFTPPPAILG